MKKISYIFLLTILFLQAGGVLLIYQMQQHYVRFEMHQTLNNDKTHFEKIILSINDYQKEKINADEIYIEGKMYDVKSINISGGCVELFVINDSQEENIVEQIKDFTESANQSNSNLPNQLQQLLSLNYLSTHTEHLFFIPFLFVTFFSHSNLNIVVFDSDIATPPPQLV